MAGFIKIYRSIFEHWIFNDAEKFKAFIDLIQLARWKDEKLLIGNKLVTIPRGSFYTSELKLAERWGWSRHKTRDFLNLLEKEKMITKKGTSKGTTITIENYSFYQDEGTTEDTTKGQQKDNKRTARGHQKDIIGYTKEERKLYDTYYNFFQALRDNPNMIDTHCLICFKHLQENKSKEKI